MTVTGGRWGGGAAARWCGLEPEAAACAGHLTFYPERVGRCLVDGEVVWPQPGEFYGGWVTDELVGPFKGAPGTMLW